MGGLRQPRGREIPVTPLLELYRRLRHQPQAERVAEAERYAAAPDLLADCYHRSVVTFASYENDEPFYPGRHSGMEPLPSGAPIVRGRDLGCALAPRPGTDPFHRVDGIAGLELRLVDYEIEPARTTGSARFTDGAKATQGMTLDLLMADRLGVPAICEVKTPGDMDPFFALVQALACAAHLASDSQRARLRAHVGEPVARFDRCDVFVILVTPASPRRALYQPRFREAALTTISGLEGDARITGSIRHLALLDAVRTEDGVELIRAVA